MIVHLPRLRFKAIWAAIVYAYDCEQKEPGGCFRAGCGRDTIQKWVMRHNHGVIIRWEFREAWRIALARDWITKADDGRWLVYGARFRQPKHACITEATAQHYAREQAERDFRDRRIAEAEAIRIVTGFFPSNMPSPQGKYSREQWAARASVTLFTSTMQTLERERHAANVGNLKLASHLKHEKKIAEENEYASYFLDNPFFGN